MPTAPRPSNSRRRVAKPGEKASIRNAHAIAFGNVGNPRRETQNKERSTRILQLLTSQGARDYLAGKRNDKTQKFTQAIHQVFENSTLAVEYLKTLRIGYQRPIKKN